MSTRVKKVHVAEVVRHGEKIVIPEKLPVKDAINVLRERMEYDESYVEVRHTIDCFPWDGAIALQQAMEERFGIAMNKHALENGMFGPMKVTAKAISVEVGPGQSRTVPWGVFNISAADDKGEQPDNIRTETHFESGRVMFALVGSVRRKYEYLVTEIAERVREIVRTGSIYRGAAFRVRFFDEDGDRIPLPTPRFWDVSKADLDSVVFSRELEALVGMTVYAPLVAREAVKAAGTPFKRGILLAGPYGTGKTLLAATVANLAIQNEITFVYLQDVRELAEGIRFARQYQPAVVFAEDIDRATTGDRSVSMDMILNTLDGVDTKDSEIMVILTTNHPENINKAMLRPGRIDALLPIEPPDNEAVQRLIRLYGGNLIAADADLTEAGEALAGRIPAVIREAVERSKLATIWRTRGAVEAGQITGPDLVTAAQSLDRQLSLMAVQEPDNRSDIEKAASILVTGVKGAQTALSAGNGAAGSGMHHHDLRSVRTSAPVAEA